MTELTSKMSRLSEGGSDAALRLARGLGWFSLGLGATELFAARPLARALGMTGREWLLRGYGLREVAAGVMSLSPMVEPGITSRIAGDALDIATLLPFTGAANPKRGNVGLALFAVLGVTALDVVCRRSLR